MNETAEYKPIRYEDRASQKLGWKHYASAIVKPLAAPALLTLAGYFIGKQFSPPAFEKEPKGIVSGIVQGYLQALYVGQKDRSQAYAMIGMKVGVFATAYTMWRKHKVVNLALTETAEQVKHLAPMQVTPEKLKEENALIEKMIAHEQQKQEALTQPEKASRQYRDLVTSEAQESKQYLR